MIALNAEKIKKALPEKIELTIFDVIESTNDFFKSFKKSSDTRMHCCLAEQQTKGRGRLDRQWHSPFGKNIYLSCCYSFQRPLHELPGLSLVMGLAIIAALHQLGLSNHISIKWPNDILYHHKKLAGILIETHSNAVIIGIGLNVNMTIENNPAIEQAWTSLYRENNMLFDRNEIAAVLIQKIFDYLQRFEIYGLDHFLQEWAHIDALAGKTVTLNHGDEKITGQAVGINSLGNLMVRLADNSIRAFASGEASLLKN